MEKKINNIEYRSGCGMGVTLLNMNKGGQYNVSIGSKSLTTPYYVDTVVYCKKCQSEHEINIGTWSKQTVYKAKCGCEFNVSGNAR